MTNLTTTERVATLSRSCRLCGSEVTATLVDLGKSPLCESFLTEEQLDEPEAFYPLHVRICGECVLAQLDVLVATSEIFTDYAYFSAYSDSWVAHAAAYCDLVRDRFELDEQSFVIELASNDGYLLQHFVAAGIPSLGIDPAANVAREAEERGVETVIDFFDSNLARRLVEEGTQADLVVANNVLAQVPALNDFIAGVEIILRPGGVLTVEVPHIVRLVEELQFDTIYHEHFSYFSLTSLARLLRQNGLEVFDVEQLLSHGGSLRVYACRIGDPTHTIQPSVEALLEAEHRGGYDSLEGYRGFDGRVEEVKWSLLDFLITLRRRGSSVVGYGAPGKGNTLLNYCGIRTDLLEYTVDRNPHKQGMFLPGTQIPIHSPDMLANTRPEYILILPWNLQSEIAAQLEYVREWGAQLVVPIPKPQVLSWP